MKSPTQQPAAQGGGETARVMGRELPLCKNCGQPQREHVGSEYCRGMKSRFNGFTPTRAEIATEFADSPVIKKALLGVEAEIAPAPPAESAGERVELPSGGTATVTKEGAQDPELIGALNAMAQAAIHHFGKQPPAETTGRQDGEKITEADWTEDFGRENGDYLNQCSECGVQFCGHKRRVICRVCAAATQNQKHTPVTRAQPAASDAGERMELAERAYKEGYSTARFERHNPQPDFDWKNSVVYKELRATPPAPSPTPEVSEEYISLGKHEVDLETGKVTPAAQPATVSEAAREADIPGPHEQDQAFVTAAAIRDGVNKALDANGHIKRPVFGEGMTQKIAANLRILFAIIEERATAPLRAEIEEWEQSFDLYEQADRRAVEMWRAENPAAQELILPDKVDLGKWLLEQFASLQSEIARLTQILREENALTDQYFKERDAALSDLAAARKQLEDITLLLKLEHLPTDDLAKVVKAIIEGNRSDRRTMNEWYRKWEANQAEKLNQRAELASLTAKLKSAEEERDKLKVAVQVGGSVADDYVKELAQGRDVLRAELAEARAEISCIAKAVTEFHGGLPDDDVVMGVVKTIEMADGLTAALAKAEATEQEATRALAYTEGIEMAALAVAHDIDKLRHGQKGHHCDFKSICDSLHDRLISSMNFKKSFFKWYADLNRERDAAVQRAEQAGKALRVQLYTMREYRGYLRVRVSEGEGVTAWLQDAEEKTEALERALNPQP